MPIDHDVFNWSALMRHAFHIMESDFMAEMRQRREDCGSKSPMGDLDAALVYSLTKWARPAVVVETGGFLGMSSAFILKGLRDAGVTDPKLYSIEAMEDIEHGGLIPERLREGFIPLTGKVEDFMASDALPGRVDLFLHDSSHRLKHMLMEYHFFWDRLSDGGLLLSHDVDMSAAFTQFVTATYAHDKIGQTDPSNTTHEHWGRWGSLGFAMKKAVSP